jgi:O-succinylhomoserine sulfhydrylase
MQRAYQEYVEGSEDFIVMLTDAELDHYYSQREYARRFMNALEIAKISNNLGDAKTIATHPATTTHQRLPEDQKAKLGITPGLIRLSVGLEDSDDLIADLNRAFGMI